MTNNSKIVLASIVLIVATGLMALSPSTIVGNAQAQMYENQYRHDSNYYQDDNRYGHDNNHQKKSYGDIQKIKCVNSNINVNGIDITQIPTDDLATAEAANDGADATGAQNGNGWGDKINFERSLVNVCINVNSNEQSKDSPTPPENGANLLVTKLVTCEDFSDESVPSVQQGIDPCTALTTTITEDQFDISVPGVNADPSQFQGSESGQNVGLDAGPYTVTETPSAIVDTHINTLEQQLNVNIEGPTPSFDEGCTQIGSSFSATGIIVAGGSQTCEITNHFEIQESDD